MNKSLKFDFQGVKNIAETAASVYGCRLLDVTFDKEPTGRVLRVIIDSDELSLELCADVSRKVSEWLDAHEKEIPFDKYTLEVSSPGADRALHSKEDFLRFVGKIATIETKTKAEDGRKKYKGEIVSVSGELIKIFVDEETAHFELNFDNIKKANLVPKF